MKNLLGVAYIAVVTYYVIKILVAVVMLNDAIELLKK